MKHLKLSELLAIIVTVTFCIIFAVMVIKGGIVGGLASLLMTIAGTAEFLIVLGVAWVVVKITRSLRK